MDSGLAPRSQVYAGCVNLPALACPGWRPADSNRTPGFTTLPAARRALAQMHPPAQQFVEPLPPSPRRSVHGVLRPLADGRPLLHAPERRHELAAQRHAPGLFEIDPPDLGGRTPPERQGAPD